MRERGLSIETVIKIAHKVVAPVRNRVNSMVARGVIDAIKADPKLQTMKVQWFGDVSEPVEHMEQGGITHFPLKGAEVVVLRTSQGIQIAVGGTHRDGRPTDLKSGETKMYGTGGGAGSFVHIKEDGTIEVTAAGDTVTINGNLVVSGDVEVGGAADVSGDVDAGGAISAGAEVTAKAMSTPVNLSTHLTPSPLGPLGPPTPGT